MAKKDGSSVIKVTDVKQLGDATRVVVKFPTIAFAQRLVPQLLAEGCELILYRSVSAYDPDASAKKRANDRALIEAAKQSIATGRPVEEFLPAELKGVQG